MKNAIIALSVALLAASYVGIFQTGMMYRELLDFRQRDAVMHMAAGLVIDQGDKKHVH
jgi:hypothetical protein